MGSMIDAGMCYDKLGMSDEAIGIACIACHSAWLAYAFERGRKQQ